MCCGLQARVCKSNGNSTQSRLHWHHLKFGNLSGVSGHLDGSATLALGLMSTDNTSLATPAICVLSNVTVTSALTDEFVAATLYPIPYFFPPKGLDRADLGSMHANNSALGILDVTLPPFCADPTGQRDSTRAIQWAIDFAYRNYLVAYFPVGTYTVTDTINCMQTQFEGGMRSEAHYLRGQLSVPGQRATLVLPPSTSGFSSRTGAYKPLVYMWHRNPTNQSQPNINMNQVCSLCHVFDACLCEWCAVVSV